MLHCGIIIQSNQLVNDFIKSSNNYQIFDQVINYFLSLFELMFVIYLI